VEDFVRDYEILAEQTFKDFHDIIQQSISGLNSHELASFYICDRRWEKTSEITLIDMEEEENQDNSRSYLPKTTMKEAVLSNFIDDPHQRLIYEYDFLNLKVFYIELLKTFESDPRKQYPRYTYASGELPKPVMLSDMEEVMEEQAEILEEDTEDYYDEEDFESLNNDIEI
jgi:hypothetical protein